MGQRFIPAGKPSLKAGPRVPVGERPRDSAVITENVKSVVEAPAPVKATVAHVEEDIKPALHHVEEEKEPVAVETKAAEVTVEPARVQQPVENSREFRKKKA